MQIKKWVVLLVLSLAFFMTYNTVPKNKIPVKYEIKDFPLYAQPDNISCGPTCLKMVISYYGKDISFEDVKKETKTSWLKFDSEEFGMTLPINIQNAMQHFGIKAKMKVVALEEIKERICKNTPVIVLLRSGQKTWHYVVAIGYTRNEIIIADPGGGVRSTISEDVFEKARAFTHDMRGHSHHKTCLLCGGDGYASKIQLGPLTKCDFCGGKGSFPDGYYNILLLADIQSNTVIFSEAN